jgi:glycosyltransferase
VSKITIITVVKNNLSGIKRTINSLRFQSFKDYEHVIIDSNSEDGTSEFLKNHLDSKTIYVREKDTGVYNAINKGVNLSKGKFIGLLHSGDFFYSQNTLFLISQNLDEIDYVFGDIIYFNKNKINRIWEFSLDNTKKLNPFKIPHTSLFLKKELIKDLGFYDESFKISSDTDFLIKLCKKKLKFKKLNNYLIYMETGGLSFSLLNFFQKAREDLKILKRYNKFLFVPIYLYKILIKFNGILFLNFNKKLKIINLNLKKILAQIENT